MFIYFSELYTIRLNDVAVFEWDNYNIEWFLVRENDFFQIKHFSFRINFDLQLLFETSGKSELEEEPGEDYRSLMTLILLYRVHFLLKSLPSKL